MSTLQGTAGGSTRILVMEDEANLANALKSILSEEGYEVDVAMTGRSALDQFQQKSFDLLVADLRLPDIDGMEVIKEVKRAQPDTEVIVITGFSTVSSAVQAMKLGASDYLAKPFTDDEIKNIISSTLKKMEPEKEITSDEVVPQTAALIQKREVLRVLNRTTHDEQFWRDIMETGTEALSEYTLRPEAKAAIVSGDLEWLTRNIGELTQKQLMFVYKRGERMLW
jgi:DNA-binding NtrC family response regulator